MQRAGAPEGATAGLVRGGEASVSGGHRFEVFPGEKDLPGKQEFRTA
ncbi:Hypothetical protein CAP_3321 [Chondromyces apiculatus DSM 436]|uniref:Uncharacterized protein n=1 Tax=Chondromyces apiculatus DSM 436 TaxID=1192034 RepID=A0A017T835_9BACT|nr:Hypothetical protein CAP_3321 [Chondromyces apiculatus DSM 436]